MANKPLPEPALLRNILDYKAGRLYWRDRPKNMFATEVGWKRFTSLFAGELADKTKNSAGYRMLRVFKRPLLAHRVIWAMHHDRWPDGQIDHINGNRTDNRIINLRSVDCLQNNRNRKTRSDSSSGHLGVYKSGKKWMAHIKVNYKTIYLGTFERIEDAIAARKRADDKYGFHPNHGRSH